MNIEQVKIEKQSNALHSIWRIKLEKEKLKEGYYLFPDNKAEIMVSLKGSFIRKIIGSRKGTTLIVGDAILSKARSRGMLIQSENDVQLLLIKMHPQYLKFFNPHPQYTFRDGVQPIRFLGTVSQDWMRGIASQNHLLVTSMLNRHINGLMANHREILDEILDVSIGLIKKQKGEIKIKELNATLGVCKSTLEQKFNKEIGISPKEFCKIEKLGHFLKNYIRYSDEMSLTQLTFKSGYYDQSHLIKDFRYYVEDSPKRFLNHANKVLLYA